MTGGIVIQRVSSPDEIECSTRRNVKRASSLKHVSNEIAPFTLGKRATIDLRDVLENIDLSEKAHEPPQNYGKKLDFLFIVSRMLQANRFPNWTGYNTLISKNSIPRLSKIVYLPIVDAPATEFSTINPILQRSIKIADELGVPYVCLVFDEAIYATVH